MEKYDHKAIENKWQKAWKETAAFATPAQPEAARKQYVLDMFPYPSGAGLHVGHPLGYTATDIYSRMLRMQGKQVLHPMGFDSFGLPAENYAIKTQTHPAQTTATSIARFTEQLQAIGFSYDWERQVVTSDPSYYQWTQWLFLQLYKKGLAYRKEAAVNWCEHDKTVLANEQVENGLCERCKNPVTQRLLKQWFFKITDYADRLIDDLAGLDWPSKIVDLQRNWIGRSPGTFITFDSVTVFTTRPDTLFGVSYVVLAPEHPLVSSFVTEEQREVVEVYIAATKRKSELERTGLDKEKTGVFTGGFVKHPLTGAAVPVWIADYALANYGTGAVMGVPAHDERDFAFAQKYLLPVKRVIDGEGECYTGSGPLLASGEFTGMDSVAARAAITEALAARGLGKATVTYHLRDWLVSRQRYWGAPIPMILCTTCGEVPVPEASLPVQLPDDVDFRPDGEAPLARSEKFHAGVTCPTCGGAARREVDTMDTFVDSAWYFLRYTDPQNTAAFASKEALQAWCPVDVYVGGAEHATKHLLYARFITKFLQDAGFVSFGEPFRALRNQGLILGSDGQKMSKSLGNVVNPDEVIAEYGADAFRLYLMFMGPFEDQKPWDTQGLIGTRRFLEKVWKLQGKVGEVQDNSAVLVSRNATIKKVGEDIQMFRFNTAVSSLMVYVNELSAAEKISVAAYKDLLLLLAPFAPHVAEELWQSMSFPGLAATAAWPTYEEKYLVDSQVTITVQVNGKVRAQISMTRDADPETVKKGAREAVKSWLADKEVVREVFVPNRLINFVLRD